MLDLRKDDMFFSSLKTLLQFNVTINFDCYCPNKHILFMEGVMCNFAKAKHSYEYNESNKEDVRPFTTQIGSS